MIDLDAIRQRWTGVYAVDGSHNVGPEELPPDIAALCDEVERLRTALTNICDEARGNSPDPWVHGCAWKGCPSCVASAALAALPQQGVEA